MGKVAKAKSTANKTGNSTKKSAVKVKTAEKLTNGHDSENENIEVESTLKETKRTKDVEEITSVSNEPENTNEEEAQSEASDEPKVKRVKNPVKPQTRKRAVLEDVQQVKETITAIKNVPNMRNKKTVEDTETEMQVESESIEPSTSKASKRKAPKVVNEKKETIPSLKSKRQKALLEVPKLNTISGKVFVIGENDVGQLGLDEEQCKVPTLLELPHSIIDIAAGAMHSVCLTGTGEVLTFGCNDEGALGRLTSDEEFERNPEKVEIPEVVVQISAGDSHSAALAASGNVYIWGNFRSNSGPMGLIREDVKEPTPVRILRDIKIVKIVSGNEHLACLSQEGIVYTLGCAETGQLGRIPDRSNTNGGRQGIMVLLTPNKMLVTKSQLIDNIWAGSYSTFLKIKDSDTIQGCGLNNYSQLGIENKDYISKPTNLTSFNGKAWSQISGGQHHTLALDTSGLVCSLGRPEYGRLGLGESSNIVSSPTEIPALQEKKCVSISSGNCVSFSVADDGSLFSWGFGDSFQLGHGNSKDQYTPKLIEGNFTEWKTLKVAGGGQHALVLATPRKS